MNLKNKSDFYLRSIRAILRLHREKEFLEGLVLFWFYHRQYPNASPLVFFGHDLRWGFWKARWMLTRMINPGVYDIDTKSLTFDTLPRPWKKYINRFIALLQ